MRSPGLTRRLPRAWAVSQSPSTGTFLSGRSTHNVSRERRPLRRTVSPSIRLSSAIFSGWTAHSALSALAPSASPTSSSCGMRLRSTSAISARSSSTSTTYPDAPSSAGAPRSPAIWPPRSTPWAARVAIGSTVCSGRRVEPWTAIRAPAPPSEPRSESAPSSAARAMAASSPLRSQGESR
eukprot:scaffold89446_cov30-Tisochrysis_lutea.AAC.1